ncbi:hypothetical protein LTR37_008859 [Vermiconidia calcicola]|uniref:Uncharacterized protein n=1 Tax=Vermiconidia calcicola TaxID=1690605 RepID=A0ACC3NAH4_9PEZI|nr:hypothetical protein LTR37_008859 [Vermiconidia calcicola]
MSDMEYKGETAYLTGGASGIGRAVTTMLVNKGMKVFVADRDVQSLRSLESEHNKDPNDPSVFTAECDVADWESQKRAFETAIDNFSRIDYVFPIAGIGERRSFPNKPNSTGFEKPDLSVVEVDEIGVIYTVSLAVQHFRRLGVKGDGFRGKSFVRSYGKILEEENITFNAVCPNKIRTNIGTAAAYEKAEKAGCLVPMEKLLEAFEMLLSKGEYRGLSGECLEVAPKLGIRVVPFLEFVNEESRVSAEITYERSRYLHEVVDKSVHLLQTISKTQNSINTSTDRATGEHHGSANIQKKKRKLEPSEEVYALANALKKVRCHENSPRDSWEMLEEMAWNEKTGLLYGEWKCE